MILAIEPDLAHFAYLILPLPVVLDNTVEVIVDFVVIMHERIPPPLQVAQDLLLLHQSLSYLLLVFPLLLDKLLVLDRNPLDVLLEFELLFHFSLQRCLELLDLVAVFEKLAYLRFYMLDGLLRIGHFLLFLHEGLLQLGDRLIDKCFLVQGDFELLLCLDHAGAQRVDPPREVPLYHVLLLSKFKLQIGHAALVRKMIFDD